jgi:hypothetical protein
MSKRISLLAGAGLSALALVGAAGTADAKTAKRHSTAQASSSQAAEIQALKEQIETLTARLDAQEAAQQSAQAQAAQAQADAAAASTQAAAAQTAAAAATKAVPDQVKTSLATWQKGKWFSDTSVSGRMYFNYSNIDQKSNGVKQAANGTGFNIKRFYLGVDHKFDDMFSANLTMDVSNVVGNTSNGNFPANSASAPANSTALVGRGFYIKKAYLQAKFSPALWIRLGAADLPWVPFVENQYGYRHIENTLIDRISYGTSADWGVHVGGDLAGGIISYQVSAINGAGYRNVKVTKSVDFEGRVSASYKGLYAGVGGYSGKRGNDTQILPTGVTDIRTATRIDAVAGYKTKLFGLGGEYFHAKNWNSTLNNTAEDKSDGYSLFGNVNFMPKWSVFGRYDWVKPTKITNDNLKDQYFNVGLQYSPAKIVDLALVYKRDKAENGTIGTQNGTIGGSVRGTYDEVGLFGQFRF